MKDAEKFIEEINNILEEIEVYDRYRSTLFDNLKKAGKEYRNGKCGYIQYEQAKQAILRGKSEEEWKEHYSSYIYSLLKRIELILNELNLRIREEALETKKTATEAREPKQEYQKIEEYYQKEKQISAAPTRHERAQNVEARLNTIKAKLARDTPTYNSQSIRYEVIKRPEKHTPQQAVAIEEEFLPLEEEFAQESLAEPAAFEARATSEKKAQQTISKPSFTFSPVLAFLKRIKQGILTTLQHAREISRNAAALAKKIHLPKLQKAQQIEKKAKPSEDEIDFTKIGETSKIYSKQRIKTVQQAAERKDSIFSSIIHKLAKTSMFFLRTPVHAARATLFVAKLPVKATLGTVKLGLGTARLIQKIRGKRKPQTQHKQEREPLLGKLRETFTGPKKTIFVEEIVGMEKEASKTETTQITRKSPGVLAGGILDLKLFSDIISRFGKKEEKIVGEQTEIPEHIKKLREMRSRLKESQSEYGFEQTLLAKESRRVRDLLENEKVEAYKSNSFGAMANIFVKKTSISLVNAFPELFEYLYNALRTANVKILSNTYVSIMVFVSISMFLTVTSALIFVFLALNYPIYEIVLRSFFFGFLAAAISAVFFFAYPFIKISERRKNITANMPFAINHLAAVSSSGVPPASMLELISESNEYGEIAVEFKKVVDLINVFGYDLLTAIRTVSASTPNQAFKEILDGMVSTIETGGDLESYLKEKAEEATLTYKLERQKYNESISTYSDIYTGVLIAAPLFFVAALAIINLLGGTIGGFGIEAIMAFGAYIAIPGLNILFLTFLQMNQPEV